MASELQSNIHLLPESPGVYRFYDSENVLIYVGKAKNIKKRVSSYFNKNTGVNRKTLRLVSLINRIEYTISDTEFDALLLENTLIKQNQPKYNILLKDDKTYPYICILKEPFPRIIYTRKYIPSQGEYFGPYSSVVAMKSVLELLHKLYTIRTCNLSLINSAIIQRKFKVCLEYHIGNCKGPCEGLQSEESYLEEIEQARNILKGNVSFVYNYFKNQMQDFAKNLQFEKANHFKERLSALEKFQSKTLVVNNDLTDIDVFSVISNDEYAYINHLQVKEGSIVYSKSIEVKKKLDETDEEILSYVSQELRTQAGSENTTIYSNIVITPLPEGISNIIPKIGDKKKLVLLSLKNALELKKEKTLLREGKKSKQNEILTILKEDLRLDTIPKTIECFDNSNFQGTNSVASMVRFTNAKPDKKNYRHYNVKTVQGPNDFASMKEIVGRRYKRMLEEGHTLPDLIIVDGGKGQLSNACEALRELDIYGKVPIIGIAKRLEEIYYPDDPLPLLINKKSPGLMLMQQIRDEAHRFAITFHRQKRSKSQIKSSLEEVEGIGKKTIEILLKEFKSVKKINDASLEDLAKVVGMKKAEIIKSKK